MIFDIHGKVFDMNYDVIIIGAGPGGIYAAYELTKKAPGIKIGLFEEGTSLEKRHCPIDGKKIKSCIYLFIKLLI